MVDTARTSMDLLTNLFQDGQAASSVTAQDIRDLIVSLKTAHGELSIDTPAATTITVAGTYYKAAGTTTLESGVVDFDDDSSTDNRLRYTGTPDRFVEVVATISMTSSANNQMLGMKLALNGIVLDDTVARHTHATGADVGSVTLTAHGVLSTNDYIEVWTTNETSTATVTLENMHFRALGHIN